MHVKICGITSADDALLAAHAGADFVGLIFAASPRRTTLATARAVVDALPAGTQAVLVFRDAPLDEIVQTIDATGARWVQLHGREPVAFLRDLTARLPQVATIKAWEVAGPTAGDELVAYLQEASAAGVLIRAVILDTPKGEVHPGYGCLAAVSRRWASRPPEIWCAGGLTPGNLAAAVSGGRYDGVDVAGGVERSPGVKDPTLVRQFIAAAKRL